ncbi:MAG: hypothetical protein HMLKMBBP_04013 [Planctomycetes bacterium]|nr:hypothetical protein [Planctomycetota bacterium]
MTNNAETHKSGTSSTTSPESIRGGRMTSKQKHTNRNRGIARGGIALAVGAASIAGFAGSAEARRADPRLANAPLVLTSFVQNGRTDVRRNEVLTFKFSALVKAASVDNRSLSVLESTGTGTRAATGALIAKNNIVRFDPTRSQRNYDDSRRPNAPEIEKDNPTGFTSFGVFQVDIVGPPSDDLHTLKNVRGARILQGFHGDFRTSDLYFDPVVGQPLFVGVSYTGQLGFDPPKSGSTGLVDEDAIIILEFSEPVDIATLDPSSTVIVKRVSVNEQVPGFIRLDPADRSGRRFQFVPSLGFGTDRANRTGWDVSVQLTEGILDLAGNKLKRPFTAPTFRTRFVPGTDGNGKPSASILTETFANQTKMDPVTVADGAEWNTTVKGELRGGYPTTYPNRDVILTTASAGVSVVRTRVNDPIVSGTAIGSSCQARPNGSRCQMLYVPNDVGNAAAITGVGWGPSSNALFAATHPGVTLRLGHTSLNALSADYEGNVNVGNAAVMYDGQYVIPQAKNIQPSDGTNPQGVTVDPNARGMWLWPTFTTSFEWNGINNLIFDAGVQAGNNCQILRIGFVPAGIPFPVRRAVSTSHNSATADSFLEPVVYDIRFQKRRRTTIGTSLFYQLASANPIFADAIVSPVSQPGGVQVVVEMQGAPGRADPLVPGGFIPDTTQATAWDTDITKVNGYQFVRFRVTMRANLTTNQSARIASIQIPYIF